MVRCWGVVITRSNFKSKTSFGFFGRNNTRHVTWFFLNVKTGSFGQFSRFFIAFLYLASFSELKIDVLVSWMRITSVNLVRDYRFFIISQETDVYVLNYRWHARARYYQVYIYRFYSLKKQKTFYHWTKVPQKDLRRWHKRVWRGKSDSALSIFVRTLFEKLFWRRGQNIFYKNAQSRPGFSSPRAFHTWSWICGSPLDLLVNWFLCASTGGPIQLYKSPHESSSRIQSIVSDITSLDLMTDMMSNHVERKLTWPRGTHFPSHGLKIVIANVEQKWDCCTYLYTRT